MNVLITGGAGFFGSKLTQKFIERGDNVTVYDSLLFGIDGCQPFIKDKNYNLVIGDVTDFDEIESHIKNNDVVIHMAALVGEPSCKKHIDSVYDINTNSSIFISKTCADNNKQFIYLSTCSNYGKSEKEVNEESVLNPLGLYSDSKIKAEEYILKSTKNSLVLRSATLFGVSHRMRVDLTINQFIYEIITNGGVSIYSESSWRPYIHVEDACNMIIMSIENKLTGVYNLGSDLLNYTKGQIVSELLLHQSGLGLPDFKIEHVEWDDPRDYRVNFSKINQVIDYKIKYDLKYGINEIFEYLKGDFFKGHKSKITND